MQAAVKENFSENILQAACKAYNIPFKEAKLTRAFSNLIFDCEGKYLRLTHSSLRTYEEVEVELDWLAFVQSQELSVVQLVLSDKGEKQVRIPSGNTHFTAVCFYTISGARIKANQWKPEFFEELGRINAQFHEAALIYPEKKELHYLHWDQIPEFDNSPFLPKDDRQLELIHDELVTFFSTLPQTADRYRIIHYDIHHGNYMVDEQGKVTILDFEMSCKSWFINDLASTIYYTAQYPLAEGMDAISFEKLFTKHFLTGYQSIRSIPEEHLQLLPKFILYRGLLVLGFLHKVTDFDKLEPEMKLYLERVNDGINRKIRELGLRK